MIIMIYAREVRSVDMASQEEEEDDLSKEDQKILTSCGLFDDLFIVLSEVKLIAPFVALIAFFLAYHLTIAPYRVTVEDSLFQPEDIDLVGFYICR